MIRGILLLDTFVAGVTYLKDKSVLKTLKAGDELFLQWEINGFDRFAILVLTAEMKKIGYVPEKDDIVFARLMDAGKMLKARISEIKSGEWYTVISISIFLVDL